MGRKTIGRGVALVAAGMSDFGAFPGKTTRDLFVEAFLDMKGSSDKDFDPADIEALYIGNYSSELFEGQGHSAPIMADWLGMTPRPATRIEDACASSGVALRQGIMAEASGFHDVLLVGGIEKMTNLPIAEITDTLATAGDVLYEIPAGFTFPGFYAAMASAYMHRYGATAESMMHVAKKNHDNGALNPKALFNATLADVMASKIASAKRKNRPIPSWDDEMAFLHDDRANPMIAWPLRLFDCSPVTDGATALLLVSEDIARSFSDDPLYIIGSGQASDTALHDRGDLTSIGAAKVAADKAYEMAGITAQDVKVAEVHDCFTIAEIIATEDLGFFPAGQGHEAVEEGLTARHGTNPVNTSGGLKAKGHPVGASGAGQAVEIYKQMRGQAGERQVPRDVDIALTHNVGGTGQTCVVHIYERR